MAKKTVLKNLEPPITLEDSPFYGLELDEDQKILRDSIWSPDKDIIFVNAKAGTGKTVVSVGTANLLVQYGRYDKVIYICSPCGNERRLGYLPGTISQKSEVLYEPLYSALDTLGINPFTAIDDGSLISQKFDSSGYIKPLTDVYLRGCNLNNSVVLIEETQNVEFHLLKKILTRVCKNTKVICIGHDGQIDLQDKDSSGFVKYIEWFKAKDDDRVAICELNHVHRSWIAEYADQLRFTDYDVGIMGKSRK